HQEHHAAGAHRPSASQRSAVAREAAGGSQDVAIDRGRQGVTVTRAVALCFAVGLAGTLARASGPEAGAATAARLTAITSHVHGKSASLVIEATEPVAYIA